MSFWEFFCGSGAVRSGFGANWRCTFANDNDRKKAATYIANFGRGEIVVADVASLTTANLPGAPGLCWANPPCQDVSLAGDHAGLDGARSGAFWRFWKLMQALRAEGHASRLIVIENVIGLLTSLELLQLGGRRCPPPPARQSAVAVLGTDAIAQAFELRRHVAPEAASGAVEADRLESQAAEKRNVPLPWLAVDADALDQNRLPGRDAGA